MAQTQHTPGPWDIREGMRHHDDGSYTVEIHEVRAGTTVICPDVHDEIDARLIAAAPDMLGALKLAERVLGRLTPDHPGALEAFSSINSAIAKAEGSNA